MQWHTLGCVIFVPKKYITSQRQRDQKAAFGYFSAQ
jgi:hypothetical protein